MVDLSTNLCGVKLDNPVIPASGTFGFGYEFNDIYDINILGSFSFKGTTRYPKDGNEQPRIAECPCGMLNSVGLQNPGIHRVIEHELPEMKKYFNKQVIANISGDKIEDYVYVASLIDKEDQGFRTELFRNVDFGVFDYNYRPLLLIEINDNTHFRKDRVERDKKVNAICRRAKLPIVTFWTKDGIDPDKIVRTLNRYL